MSLDYPYYEELCRRKHRAAWWWLVGDRLYYLGLIPAMIAVPASGLALIGAIVGFGWQRLVGAMTLFVVGMPVFCIGVALKRYAYTLGERDEIFAVDVETSYPYSSFSEKNHPTREDDLT